MLRWYNFSVDKSINNLRVVKNPEFEPCFKFELYLVLISKVRFWLGYNTMNTDLD